MTDERSWAAATWEGARHAALQRTLRLSVRERLEVLESLSETAEHLARIGAAARADRAARREPPLDPR